MAKLNDEFITIQEVVRCWRECINQLGEVEDMRVAYDMVNVVCNDHFDDWYQDDEILFAEAFDLLAALEIPNGVTEIGTDEMRRAAWERVKFLLKQLEAEYLR